jgi:hypothetical protein
MSGGAFPLPNPAVHADSFGLPLFFVTFPTVSTILVIRFFSTIPR